MLVLMYATYIVKPQIEEFYPKIFMYFKIKNVVRKFTIESGNCRLSKRNYVV